MAKKRVVIFVGDVSPDIRFDAKKWQLYLCQRLRAAGILFKVRRNDEPVPLQPYRWSRYSDGSITVEQADIKK